MNFSYYPHRLPSVKVAAIPVIFVVILIIYAVASGPENEVDGSPQSLVDGTSIEGNSQENNEEEQMIIDAIAPKKSDEEEKYYDSGEYDEEPQKEDVDTTTPKVCRPPHSTPVEICPLPSSWTLRPGKKCTGNTTAELTAFRSSQQKYLDAWWSLEVSDDVKWTAIIGAYDQSFITLKQLFRFVSDGERKLFLDFVDRNATCNIHTWGVGGDFNGESLFYNRYPQCRFTAVDPESVVNRELVERVPNARFIQSTIGAESGTYGARIRGTNGVYASQTMTHRGVVEFFEEHNGDETIDLLLIDIEGAEFTVLPKLVEAKSQLPKICQLNVEIHAPAEAFGTTTQRALESIHTFLSDGTYSIVNVETLRRLLRVFLINTSDDEYMNQLDIIAFVSIGLIGMLADSCFVQVTSQKTRRPETCQKGTFFVKTDHEVLFGLMTFERRPLQARTAKFDMTFDDYKIEFSMTKTRDDAYINIGQEILYFPVDIQITPYVVTFEDRVKTNVKFKCSTDFTPREHYEAYRMKLGYSSEVPIPGLEIEFYAKTD